MKALSAPGRAVTIRFGLAKPGKDALFEHGDPMLMILADLSVHTAKSGLQSVKPGFKAIETSIDAIEAAPHFRAQIADCTSVRNRASDPHQ